MGSRANKEAKSYGYGGTTPAPGQTTVDRPKVGPADPATRSREIAKRLSEKEPRPPKPAPAPKQENPTADLSIDKARRRIGGYYKKLDDEIERQSK